MNFEPVLNDPQTDFFELEAKYKAFVAGYGSGKTWVGCAGIFRHAWEWPGVDVGYFAPTFPQIRDIFYPTVEEAAEHWGLKTEVVISKHEVKIMDGRQTRCRVICRSMDAPGKIVGFKIGHALVDEIDLLPPHKALTAWRKIIARLRYNLPGLRNGVDLTTTPEGFGFTYQTFVKDVRDHPERAELYKLIQASTYDNEANLPSDYITSLRASYPPQLVNAYLNGQFVNLTSGAVYADFDRKLNHTDDAIKTGDVLHVGIDFNVLNMTAIACVTRDGSPHAVAELTKVRDTPAMAQLLKSRFAGHSMVLYPDASGDNTSSKNANESDFTILRQAGFVIYAKNSNPLVRSRVNAVNALVLNANGERRLKVNTQACPALTEALEQQAYDKFGDPDKSTGHDHPVDALGYRIMAHWPITRPVATVAPLRV